MALVGRKTQLQSVDILLKSKKSEFLAVVGRRRVGKTCFIDKPFEKNRRFRLTGIQGGSMSEQRTNFSIKLAEYMGTPFVPTSPENWQQLTTGQSYKIWTGYAFETLCFKHIDRLKEALGIAAVYTEVSSYLLNGDDKIKGFQIDFVLQRNDHAVHLCETKYHNGDFTVNTRYAKRLIEQKKIFRTATVTTAALFTTLIDNHKLTENTNALHPVDTVVSLTDIFE